MSLIGVRDRCLRLVANPWAWAVIAGVVRLGMLAVLPQIADHLAINLGGQPFVQAAQQTAAPNLPKSPIAFLQGRALLRPLTEDESAYDEMAKNLVAGRGFVLDSKWMITTPGRPAMYAGCSYPLFVAAVYAVFGAGAELPVYLIQILLAALAAGWIYKGAARVGGALAGSLAAAFYAFHPNLIWSSVSMMSEAICVPLIALVLWILTVRSRSLGRAVALGVLWAVLCLARSTFADFVWVIAALLVFERRLAPLGRRLLPAGIFVASFVVVCAPWTIRNYVHWGRFIPFSTKSGTNAWMHNHPGLHVEFSQRAVFGPQPVDIFDPQIQNLPDEATRDERLMQMFVEFAKANPGTFLGLAVVRAGMSVLPVSVTSKSALAVVTAWYAKGTVLIALLLSVWLVRPRLYFRMRAWVLFAVYWTLLQSLAGSGLRYRLPADPAWALIVGALAAAILAAFWRSAATPLAHRWVKPARRRKGPLVPILKRSTSP
jgi:4-amino-4-deoxy-L-arabinose transferase-like glycosyltransferase